RLPPGDGCPRTLRQAVPAVRRKNPAHSLRQQRNQLLRALPNRRKSSCRPQPLAPAALRLATHPGRTRSPKTPLRDPHPLTAQVPHSLLPTMAKLQSYTSNDTRATRPRDVRFLSPEEGLRMKVRFSRLSLPGLSIALSAVLMSARAALAQSTNAPSAALSGLVLFCLLVF